MTREDLICLLKESRAELAQVKQQQQHEKRQRTEDADDMAPAAKRSAKVCMLGEATNVRPAVHYYTRHMEKLYNKLYALDDRSTDNPQPVLHLHAKQ